MKRTEEMNGSNQTMNRSSARGSFGKKMKRGLLIVIAALSITAFTVPAFAGEMNGSSVTQQAASRTINPWTGKSYYKDNPADIVDQYARVHYEKLADGYSKGYIEITDRSIWDNGRMLTQIGGKSLEDIITNGTAKVYGINTVHDGGIIWDNTLTVFGTGSPTNQIELHFTDETGDRYELSIFGFNLKKNHTVWYNSDAPKITKIEWEIGNDPARAGDDI